MIFQNVVLFFLLGGEGAKRTFSIDSKETNQNVSSGEDSSGGSSPVEIKSLSPGRIVPQLQTNDEKERILVKEVVKELDSCAGKTGDGDESFHFDAGEDSSGGSSSLEIQSLSPDRIVPQPQVNDEKDGIEVNSNYCGDKNDEAQSSHFAAEKEDSGNDSPMEAKSSSRDTILPQPQTDDDPLDGSNIDKRSVNDSSSSADAIANWRIQRLEKLSRDFRSSPRMVVRGVYKGDELSKDLTFIVKRKTEGTLVEILLKKGQSNILLMVKARMGYKYDIAQNQQTREKYGGKTPGGWFWQGHGWGHNVVQPTSLDGEQSDSSPKYAQLNEAVLWYDTPAMNWHFDGPTCTRQRNCREEECGVRIWHLNVKTFAVEDRDGDLHKGPQADKLIHFSLLNF